MFTISPKQKERKIFPSNPEVIQYHIPRCWICNKSNEEISLSLCCKQFGSHHKDYQKKWDTAYKESCRGSNSLYSFICFECAH